MLIAHKICLRPNQEQASYFARAAGSARFAYNWALAEWGKQYQAWRLDNTLPKPSHFSLSRALNAIKKQQFPWMLQVSKRAPQIAIIQLGTAFQNFFAGRAKYPKCRKKGLHHRFSLSNDQFRVNARQIGIPRLGWVRMWEGLRFAGKIMSATISRVADKWYASISVELPDYTPRTKAENQGAVGVDLGVAALATLSSGEKISGPKPLPASLRKLQRLSRGLSRKVKGSKNRHKARLKVARLHERISAIRQDGLHARISAIRQDRLHQLTTSLTRRFAIMGMEDLSVQGMVKKNMVKNRALARAIADMGFFEFRRQLEYQARWRGALVVVADKWFASSKICSHCAHQLESLPLGAREWTCPNCRSRHDRDVNAALNLRNMAVSFTVSVAGEKGSGLVRVNPVQPASMKQKASSKLPLGSFAEVW